MQFMKVYNIITGLGLLGAFLLIATYYTHTAVSVDGQHHDSSSGQNRSAFPDPNQEFTKLEANALAIRFEIRWNQIQEQTRQATEEAFRATDFALLPGRSIQSVIQRECLPRARALRTRAEDYDPDVIDAAVPAVLLATDSKTICRDLVFQTICETRPALLPCDPAALLAKLTAVDRLQFDFQAKQQPTSTPAAQLQSFEEYVQKRRLLLRSHKNDEALFEVQDDHARLLLKYAVFRSEPATRKLSAQQRIQHYETLVASFEDKHAVSLKAHDGELRDHAARMLELLGTSGASPGDRDDENESREAERFEILKRIRGIQAAQRDQALRRARQKQSVHLNSFVSERERRLTEISAAPGSVERRTAIRKLEEELTGKYFSD